MKIGLIAHNGKKKLMQNFCIAYRNILNKHILFATGTTGRLIEEAANLSVYKYLSGPLGGEQQMAAQVEHNDMDLVIFLRDPESKQPDESEYQTVIRLCDLYNIPLATNLASAEIMLFSLDAAAEEGKDIHL